MGFDGLHNATKEIFYPEVVATMLPHQFCIATKAPGMLIDFEGLTQFEMPSDTDNKGAFDDKEWIEVDASGPDDAWVDVDKGVPSDIGRGASDVPNGTSTPGQTRIVLQVIKDYYKKESTKAFNWRLENVEK